MTSSVYNIQVVFQWKSGKHLNYEIQLRVPQKHTMKLKEKRKLTLFLILILRTLVLVFCLQHRSSFPHYLFDDYRFEKVTFKVVHVPIQHILVQADHPGRSN